MNAEIAYPATSDCAWWHFILPPVIPSMINKFFYQVMEVWQPSTLLVARLGTSLAGLEAKEGRRRHHGPADKRLALIYKCHYIKIYFIKIILY